MLTWCGLVRCEGFRNIDPPSDGLLVNNAALTFQSYSISRSTINRWFFNIAVVVVTQSTTNQCLIKYNRGNYKSILFQCPAHTWSFFISTVILIQHLFRVEISISTILMIQMENQYLFNAVLLSGRMLGSHKVPHNSSARVNSVIY